MCHISPKVDFAFKKLFGSEENKDLLIALINAILEPKVTIQDVKLKNPYNLEDYRRDKRTTLNIKAVDENGIRYNIEMHIGQDLNFDKRSVYYWSKMVTEQLTKGMMYKRLDKTICINILYFNFIFSSDNFHNTYKILNEETGANDDLHNMFELHYIELRKFRKEYCEIASALDRWITFLSKAGDLDKNMLPEKLASDNNIVKAITAIDRMFDEEERDIYQTRMLAQIEFESKIDSALEKRRRERREAGEKKKAIDIAKKMLDKNLDIDSIIEITGLDYEEIKNL